MVYEWSRNSQKGNVIHIMFKRCFRVLKTLKMVFHMLLYSIEHFSVISIIEITSTENKKSHK